MSIRLFTYGTLEIPEVIQTVTGNQYASIAATAEGYARYLLKGRAYPALVKETRAITAGTLYLDLDAAALSRLDAYEDTCYEKQTIQVLTEDKRTLDALAYVLPERRCDQLSTRQWDKEAFIKNELPRFLDSIVN